MIDLGKSKEVTAFFRIFNIAFRFVGIKIQELSNDIQTPCTISGLKLYLGRNVPSLEFLLEFDYKYIIYFLIYIFRF